MARVNVVLLVGTDRMRPEARQSVIAILKALKISPMERWLLYRSWALETGATVSRDELEDR